VFAGVTTLAFGQTHPLLSAQSTGTVPVQMIVTVEALHRGDIPPVTRDSVTAFRDTEKLPVTGWLPLQGENASMDLYLLLDEAAGPMPTQLNELKRFVSFQPATTSVGIAYMHNGSVEVAQFPTKDHARAAAALQQPPGLASALESPYRSLSDLVNCEQRCWQDGSLRREVVMVTDGIDRFGSIGYGNVYVDGAVADAQRAGVIVYTFYAPGIGHSGHSPSLIHWGQTYLEQIAEETGGEAYTEPMDSYQPALAELSAHLAHQYEVTFLAKPAAAVQQVRFATQTPGVELVAAHGFILRTLD